MLRKVTKEGGYTRDATVKGKRVTFDHATKHKATGNIYALRTTFDFTGVPEDVVERLAGETILIRWRTAFKNAEKVDEAADGQIVNVAKMLTGRKPRMSKAEKASRLFQDMSVADKKAWLAEQQALLQAQIDGEDEDDLEDEDNAPDAPDSTEEDEEEIEEELEEDEEE